MDIKKNDILTVEITDTGTEGEGIGKLALPAPDAADTEEKAGGKAAGFTLFVKDAVIGDTVQVKVMKAKKNYAYAKSKVNITYFRDSNAKEIDVFVEENNVIHPLEIKKSAAPDRREIKKYSVLDKAFLNRGNCGIICMCEEPIPIYKDNCFIPSNLI